MVTVLEEADREHSRINKKTGKIIPTWKCKCECGTVFYTTSDCLDDTKKGMTISCGCFTKNRLHKEFHDLTGKKFGKLTALFPIKIEDGSYKWRC